MGRTLKRVPLDFNWPIGQIWKGYYNPYSGVECKTCKGTGSSPEARKYDDDWFSFGDEEWIDYIHENGKQFRYNNKAHQYHLTQVEVDALIDGNRLGDLRENDHVPTVEEVNEWAKKHIMSHDGINRYICQKAFLKSQGIENMVCPMCEGHGVIYPTAEIAHKADRWYDDEKFDPPKGEGYQLWETTTEGSPMTPVFKTASELAEYCAKNCSVFGSKMWTAVQWLDSFGEHPDMIGLKQGNAIFI
jgi:hypothetical protein